MFWKWFDALYQSIGVYKSFGIIAAVFAFILFLAHGFMPKNPPSPSESQKRRVIKEPTQAEVQRENRGCLVFIIIAIITVVLFLVVM